MIYCVGRILQLTFCKLNFGDFILQIVFAILNVANCKLHVAYCTLQIAFC